MAGRYISISLALAALLIGNLLLGTVSIPADEVLRALTGGETARESWAFIVWEYRVPRP